MNQFATIALQLLVTIFLKILIPTRSQSDPIFIYCYEFYPTQTYTIGSQFKSNLVNLLFPALISNGSLNGFSTAISGNYPDTAYGLAQCRGDVSNEECSNCLNTATVGIINKCPNHKEAAIRYDYCLLSYSYLNFFTHVQAKGFNAIYSFYNASDPVLFGQRLGFLMNNLTTMAMSKPSRFETGSILLDININIYALVQCTRDLSSPDCSLCLQFIIKKIPDYCEGRTGGQILTWSCYLRFEEYQFFQYLPPQPQPQPPPPPPSGRSKKDNSGVQILIGIPVLLLLAIFVCLVKRKAGRETIKSDIKAKDEIGSAESLQFELVTIRKATDNFSDANKLGEGGFGAVYKGVLLDGHEIAVKRLSSNSRQGSQEFRTEVVLLHKLQHRNLVKLLGFCLEGEEKILIYEYVPNRSLDKYLCDPTKRMYLDWERRNKIIGGIARGLLYLHEDSRLRIIHRDLKAGNILLDEEMNAKIADFGMAKLFGVDQTQGNTSKIAGTFGYMAPEYARHGLFSVKSDVYSFGVLVLEIISGQRINHFCQSVSSKDLLSYAWKLWKEGTALDLMDPTLVDSFSRDEVMRSIHIGLLCVQESIEDRPTMSSVVLILNSESLTLSSPSQPAFFADSTTGSTTVRQEREFDQSGNSSISFSANELSLVKTNPR